jgi:hypothetical protein
MDKRLGDHVMFWERAESFLNSFVEVKDQKVMRLMVFGPNFDW